MNAHREQDVALVLAAHGDRGGDTLNDSLAAHVAALERMGRFARVTGGVLNGEPSLEDALAEADSSGAAQIIVYPLFMSAGYFVKTVLSERVGAAALATPAGIMQPLGLDKRLALLTLESALRATRSAGLDSARARLLLIGHGSKYGSENADATRRAARLIAPHSPYARVETAFLEEAPFIADALVRYDGISVIAGYLSGDGLHASEDVPDVIRKSGKKALYTGPIGIHPRVPELIASSVRGALPETGGEGAQSEAEAQNSDAPVEPPSAEERPARSPESEAATMQTDRPQPGRARRGGGPVGFLIKAAAAIVMLAVLAAGAVGYLVPENVVRNQVVSLVKQQTGRDLTVRGKTSFALFPNVGVELEDVSVSNPQGMAAGETLRMKALNLDLKLLPLLSRRVEVGRFVLVRPEINLLVDAQGRRNWELKKTAAAPPATDIALHSAPPEMTHAQAGALSGGMVQNISLGSVEITDGAVNYTNEQSGVRERVEAVNVSLAQPRLAEPLDAEGNLVWKGQKVTFDGRLATVSALLRNEPADARVSVSTGHGKGSFDGNVSLGESLAANGAVEASTPSLRALVQWLGNPMPPGGGLGPAAVSGHLGVAGDTITFSKAKLGLDGMNGQGQVSLRLKGVRPHITASLNLDKLDLNPYLEGAAASPRPAPAASPKPAPQAQPAAPAPDPQSGQSLTDFIEKLNKEKGAPAPQVRAWSQRAIDFAGLRAADADVKLTTGAIHYKDIKAGRSDVTATLKSGVLNADLSRLELYSGSGTGRVTLNGARAVPAVAILFNLNGISALPLLKDAADFDWVSGRANLALSVSGTGNSQSDIMRSLQGQGQFAFADGAVEGVNIPAMMRGLKQGQLDGWKRNEREKTDFSRLTASFTVQQGVASNKDLSLVGPLIRMSGEGTVDLGAERVDYSALPRIVASLEGQGATADGKKGLAVPVRITGPWANPKIVPDLERLLNDPELTQETMDKVGKALKKLKNKEDVNNLLQGLLGGGNQAPGDGAQQDGAEKVKPEDVLKKLFR